MDVKEKRARYSSQRGLKRQTCTRSRASEDILTPHGSVFDDVISLTVKVSGDTAKKLGLTACVCAGVSGRDMLGPHREPGHPQCT